MRRQSGIRIFGGVALIAFSLALRAEDEPKPITVGGFETQGSVTAGYRFTCIKGYEPRFIELFDLRRGFRLTDFNIMGRAQEGASTFADSYSLSVSGLGGDPFPGGQLTVHKDKLYDLRVSYRQSYYYWDRNDGVIPPGPTGQPLYHNLTTNHNWATVRRFGSLDLTVHATNNLRFKFEYNRSSRDGVNFTTRTLDYFGSSSIWAGFIRANPYYVEAPLNEVANRFAGGLSYTVRNWNFHYKAGYQNFEQMMNWFNPTSPERSINIDSSPTNNEKVTNASWSEFRRLKSPFSEFSYSGKVNHRLDLRGGYIFYRYRGPATLDATFEGSARTNSSGTQVAPYGVTWANRAHLTEPTHVVDQGMSLKITDWWNLHADYRYSQFTVDSLAEFDSLFNATTAASGETEYAWRLGMHQVDLNMEFIPTRSFIFRPGIRYLKRDIKVLEDGVLDPARTRQIKSVWPNFSVYYQPSKMFSVRGDFQSITNGASYTRISPHTDLGWRFVVRFKPTDKLAIEDNLVIRDRKFQDTDFRSTVRLNAITVTYAVHDRFSIFGGLSYDSFFAQASVTFLRGTAPLTAAWRDQTVSRVWQAGLAVKPARNFGINFTGNFVRTTGAGTISGEPPYFGPMTWPMATGTVYYDFPKAGRLSVDLQRTYYLEEIIRGNDFRGNLLMIRWTKDF